MIEVKVDLNQNIPVSQLVQMLNQAAKAFQNSNPNCIVLIDPETMDVYAHLTSKSPRLSPTDYSTIAEKL